MEDLEETSESGLRYEWLTALKKDELKLLCENRGISTLQNTKSTLIDGLLKTKKQIKYESLTKPSLILELKAKNIEHEPIISKSDLVELCNENKATKLTKDILSSLTLPEIQKLCNRRGIKSKEYSSKKSLIQLLESTNAPDPIFGASMTSKQLTAETKGRGLKTSSMKKDELLKILRSNICYEDQKLESHLSDNDHIITNTKNALIDFISFMKEHKEIIRKSAKKEIMQNRKRKKNSLPKERNYLTRNEWKKLEDTLTTACDDIVDIRTMIEVYGDTDLGKDEELPQNQNFENAVPYDNDSNIDEGDDCADIVYVVYDDDEKLVMRQSQEAILAVFNDENQAERFKKKYVKKHKGALTEIQELRVNYDWGSEVDEDSD